MKVTSQFSYPSHEANDFQGLDSRGIPSNSFPYSTSGLWFPPSSAPDFQQKLAQNDQKSSFQGSYPKPQHRAAPLPVDPLQQEGKPEQLDVWMSSLDKRSSNAKLYERGLTKCTPHESRKYLDLVELISSDSPPNHDIPFPSTLYVFRSGISPIWHDQANIKGGRFTLVLSLPYKKDSLKKFNDLVQILNLFHSTPKTPAASQETLNLLTERNIVSKERALFRREVVGVSLKFQDTVNILSVWNKFAFNPNKLSSLTFVLSKLLGVSSARLRYRSHQESSGAQKGTENSVNTSVPSVLPNQATKPVTILNKKGPVSPPAGLSTGFQDGSEFRREGLLIEKSASHFTDHGTLNAGSSSSPPGSWLGSPSEYSLWSDDQDIFSREWGFNSRRNSEEGELPEIEEEEKDQNQEISSLYEYYSTLAQQEAYKKQNGKKADEAVNFLPLLSSISCFPIVEEQTEGKKFGWSDDLHSARRATTRQLQNRLEVLQLVESYYTITSKLSV